MTESVLNKIVANRRESIAGEKQTADIDALQSQARLHDTRSLTAAIRKQKEISLIAEIKTASPSKGMIRDDTSIAKIAETYARAGASAFSVLTEPDFFNGQWGYMKIAREDRDLPVMCKDFIIDEFQLLAARANGADAVLLIAAVLNDEELSLMISRARELGLEVLTEAINKAELERVLASDTDLIGINNRDLHTLKVDLNTSFDLLQGFTDSRPVITESGIFKRHDVYQLEKAGADGILVGTALMESQDIASKIKELLGKE